jgi:hypothetical protein
MTADRICQRCHSDSLSSPAYLGNLRDRQYDLRIFPSLTVELDHLFPKTYVSHYSRRPTKRYSPDIYHRKLIFAAIEIIQSAPSAAPITQIGPCGSCPHDESSFSLFFPLPHQLCGVLFGTAADKTCKSRKVVDPRWIRERGHMSRQRASLRPSLNFS